MQTDRAMELHRRLRLACRPHGDRHLGPEEWRAATPPQDGAWSPDLAACLDAPSGVTPRLGIKEFPPLSDAPGSYAHAH